MCAKITLREKLKKEKRKEARHNTVKGRHPACHALERAGRSDSAHGRRGGQKSKRGGGVSRLVCLHERKRRDGIFGVFGRVRTHSIRRWYSSNFRYNPLFTPGLAGPALLTGRLI